MGAQFCRQHEAGVTGLLLRRLRVGRPTLAQPAHGRQAGKAVTEALHAAAFVVHGNQQFRPRSADRRGERTQLFRLGVVAGKQDHSADQRMLENLALFRGDFIGGHVEHDGAGMGVGSLHGFSMTAKATT